MRFLMLNWRDPRNPSAGGAERVTRAYLAELVRRGHQAYWFTNEFPGCTREETIDGITIVRGGFRGSSVLKAIQWYRNQPPFDLVIDQHHGIPWYAPWWCKTNSIAYIHEVLGPIWRAFYPWHLSTIGQFQERWTHWLYRNVPFWVPSDSTKQSLLANGVKQVSVFPNGTDATPIPQLEPKPLCLPLRLVAVCRLAPNKRVDHAIKTVHELACRGIEAQLTIIGTGEVEAQLKQLTTQLGLTKQITFTGLLNEADKNAAMQRAHFLIHTSVREGWGLNVIEANAMGTPAVVYPVGGLVDSVVRGKTGIITSEQTPESVAAALVGLLGGNTVYHNYRQNAWQRAHQLQWNRVLVAACDWLESQARRKCRSK